MTTIRDASYTFCGVGSKPLVVIRPDGTVTVKAEQADEAAVAFWNAVRRCGFEFHSEAIEAQQVKVAALRGYSGQLRAHFLDLLDHCAYDSTVLEITEQALAIPNPDEPSDIPEAA